MSLNEHFDIVPSDKRELESLLQASSEVLRDLKHEVTYTNRVTRRRLDELRNFNERLAAIFNAYPKL